MTDQPAADVYVYVTSPFIEMTDGGIRFRADGRMLGCDATTLAVLRSFTSARTLADARDALDAADRAVLSAEAFVDRCAELCHAGALLVYPVRAGRRSYFPKVRLGIWASPQLNVRMFDTMGLALDDVLTIGSYCSIADGVDVFLPSAGFDHLAGNVTTFPLYQLAGVAPRPEWFAANLKVGRTEIGNDVWIGSRAMLLAGVTIGDGAIIAANAVVRGEVPPYAIYAGNPGRVVALRFPSAIVERLLVIRWWDWPEEKILSEMPHFYGPIEAFVARHAPEARTDLGTMSVHS